MTKQLKEDKHFFIFSLLFWTEQHHGQGGRATGMERMEAGTGSWLITFLPIYKSYI